MTDELDPQTQQPHTETHAETNEAENLDATAIDNQELDGAEDKAAGSSNDSMPISAEADADEVEAKAEAPADTYGEGTTASATDEEAVATAETENGSAGDSDAADSPNDDTDGAENAPLTPEEIDAITDKLASTVLEPLEDEDAAASSAFVPGETPVADPGTAVPSFLQLEHPTIGADAVEPHTQGFSVIEGGAPEAKHESATEVRGEAPAPVDSSSRGHDLGAAAAGAAGAVGSFIAQGASAMREMNAAKKALSDARAHLGELDRAIADQADELESRRDIAQRYPQIMAEQRKAIATAQKQEAAAEISRDAHVKKAEELKAKLEQAKEEDATTERRLKAAVDAAEARESNSRENGNRLTRRVEDARRIRDKVKTERDTGVAAAKQTITATRAQLETLRKEYAELQRNPSANPANYTVRTNELSAQISDTADALRKAEEDLPRTTEDLEHSLAAAEEALKQAEAPIAEAKKAHLAVTAEADAARSELQTAREAATARQRELREKIAAEDKARREQEQTISNARSDAAHAQSLIDQATDVHEHPEVAEALAGALERDRAERDEVAREVETLEATEKNVRERTRDSRLKFTGALVLIAAVVIVLVAIWLLTTR